MNRRFSIFLGGLVTASAVLCAGFERRARAEDPREPAFEPAGISPPSLPPAPAPAPGPAAKKRYFYKGYDYGAQSLFNPLTLFVSRAYDVFQLHPTERSPFRWNYGTDLGNVLRNAANPIGPVSREGWGRWLREEIFPLSWTPASARWAPNYSLHLIGGGMSYRMMREWFEDHDVPTPVATSLSILTLYAAALVNESLENHGTVGDNTDCIADLLVFDALGVVLFSFDGVAEFFSSTFIVSDWSLQSSLVLPSGDLQNVGNYYAGKLPLPFFPRLRLFGYGGFSTLGGLSYVVGDGYSISAAAGGRVDTFTNSTVGSVFNVVSLRPSGALFIDRNESLLASVQVSETSYYRVSANLYPNAFFHMDPGIGLWTAVNGDGSFLVGVSITRALGLGVGAGTF